MIIAGIDTETTGFDPGDHRMVEVYVGLWKDRQLVREYETRIDPQRAMPVEAQRVHGISAADLVGKPLFKTIAPNLQAYIAKADLIVWHNGPFDLRFLEYEFRNAGMKMPDKPSIDTLAEGVWATPDGKSPSLEELCFACGVKYDPALAHAAAYDVRDTLMPAFFNALDWGFFKLPEQLRNRAPEGLAEAA